MFQNSTNLNQPPDKYDVSSVETMMWMFNVSFYQHATLTHFGLVLPSPARTYSIPTLLRTPSDGVGCTIWYSCAQPSG